MGICQALSSFFSPPAPPLLPLSGWTPFLLLLPFNIPPPLPFPFPLKPLRINKQALDIASQQERGRGGRGGEEEEEEEEDSSSLVWVGGRKKSVKESWGGGGCLCPLPSFSSHLFLPLFARRKKMKFQKWKGYFRRSERKTRKRECEYKIKTKKFCPRMRNTILLLLGICGPVSFYGQVHHGRSVSEPLCLYPRNCYLTLAASLAGFATLIPPSDGAGSSDFQRSVDFHPS